MMVFFLLGCAGVVMLLHGANFFFHALSSHLAFRSLSFLGFIGW
ncbi:Trigger factor like [Actinidia chinensis var. chinensis]|uniref:Trigger factor like n=1 Tax=Actinidia chinensis var. chinensis TaxID=1590841 RepID=A0A2R6RAQ8_ACTCC|nr:Trigger factor like [Actinidia chinensis var. chinensis]